MHLRYAVNHGFLSESAGKQTVAISRIVNAFFRWEFNSCEMLVVGDDVYPIDYANACPDVSVTSLHYYFPWAITALVRWSTYCVVNGRKSEVDLQTRRYFEIADDESMSYDEKVDRYLALADEHFETERYWEWSEKHLAHLPEAVLEWVTGDDFDRLLRDTVAATYPSHEQEEFLAHFRGLVGLWAEPDGSQPTGSAVVRRAATARSAASQVSTSWTRMHRPGRREQCVAAPRLAPGVDVRGDREQTADEIDDEEDAHREDEPACAGHAGRPHTGAPRTGRSSARARRRRPAPCSAAPGTRPRRHRCRRPGG